MHIFWINYCWESICDKKKKYGYYRKNYQKVETRIWKRCTNFAFYLALKGHPICNFEDQIKPEKLHGVKYTGAYENESARRDFTFCISIFFEENVKES